MSNAPYYSHDSDMWNDPKIIKVRRKYGIIGYGLVNRLNELLRVSEKNRIGMDDDTLDDIIFDLQDACITREMLDDIILHYKLYEREVADDDCEFGYFYSKRMRRNMEKMEEIKQKRSYAGQMSGKARQVINTSSTSVQQKGTIESKKKSKSKVKEKEIITIDSIESNGKITLLSHFGECFKQYFGHEYHANFGKDGKLLKQLEGHYGYETVIKGITYFFKEFIVGNEFSHENPDVGIMSVKWNSMISQGSGKKALTKQQKKIQNTIKGIAEVDLD